MDKYQMDEFNMRRYKEQMEEIARSVWSIKKGVTQKDLDTIDAILTNYALAAHQSLLSRNGVPPRTDEFIGWTYPMCCKLCQAVGIPTEKEVRRAIASWVKKSIVYSSKGGILWHFFKNTVYRTWVRDLGVQFLKKLAELYPEGKIHEMDLGLGVYIGPGHNGPDFDWILSQYKDDPRISASYATYDNPFETPDEELTQTARRPEQ